MTISYIEPVITYVSSGNGTYPFAFKVLAESDINVWYTSASTGARVKLVRGSDFSVTAGNPGGTVTILDNAPAGGQILIERRVPIDQPTNWVNNGPFDMDLLEADLDRIIMIVQQLGWDVSSGQAAINYRGPWVTLAEYTIRDLIKTSNGNYYFCVVSHTAGTFATDLAAGKWVLVLDFAAVQTQATNAAASAADALASKNTAIARAAAAELSEIAAAASEVAAAQSASNTMAAAANIADWPGSTGLATDVAALLGLSRRNLLDNGDFSIWQRDTSFNPSAMGIPVHTADRWRCINGPAVTSVTRQIFTQNSAAGLFYTSYVYRATFAGSYGGVKILSQFVEGLSRFLGKTVTFSFYARSSIASGSIYVRRELYYGDEAIPTDGASPSGYTPAPHGNLTTSWVRYSATFTIPAGTAKTITEPDHGLRLNIVTSVSGGYVEVAKVQLEYGNAATDFEEVPPAVNLLRCQRFYEKATVYTTWAQYTATLMQISPITYSTPKRIAIAYPYCAGMDFYGTTGAPTSVSTWRSAVAGIAPVITTAAATVGRAGLVYFTWVADAEPDSAYLFAPSTPSLTVH